MTSSWRPRLAVAAFTTLCIAAIAVDTLESPQVGGQSESRLQKPAVMPESRPVVPALPPSAAAADSAGTARKAWPLDEVAANPRLAATFGYAIDQCRSFRVERLGTTSAGNSDSAISIGGRPTSCDEIFEAYNGELTTLLGPLRHSADPQERGYFHDGRYDDLALDEYLVRVIDHSPEVAAARRTYFAKTDEHFLEVARDADSCSLDSVVRLHLGQRLTSPRYNNPEIGLLLAYVVAAKHSSAAVSQHVQERANGISPTRVEEIRETARRAMSSCSASALADAIARYSTRP